mgnify:CR=1 FL=1
MREDIKRELDSLRNDVSLLNNRILKLSEIVENELEEEISLEKNINEQENTEILRPIQNRIPRPNQDIPKPIQNNIPRPIQENNFTSLNNAFTPLNNNDFTPLNNNMSSEVGTNKKIGSLEDSIGKNVMGIIASILIFIGLGTFMISVFSSMSELIKGILLLLFSFGLFGFGWFKLNKDKNAFSLSLTSCGIGAVYISLLISFFAFEIGNEILLFVELVAWSMAVFWMSKRISSFLFNIIGYIGVVIALTLGLFSELSETSVVFLLLTIVYIALTYLFSRTDFNMKNNNSLKLTVYGMSLFASIIFVLRSINVADYSGDILTTFSSLIYVCYNFYILYDLYRNRVHAVGACLFLTPLAFFSMIGIKVAFSPYIELSVWPVAIIIILFLILFEVLDFKNDIQYKWVRSIFANLGIFILAFVMTFESEFISGISEYTFFNYLIIPTILYYMLLQKDNTMMISVFSLYFISVISMTITSSDYEVKMALPIISHIISLCLIGMSLKQKYSGLTKNLLYVLTVLTLGGISALVGENVSTSEEAWLLYYVMGIILVLFVELTGVSTNWLKSGSFLKRNEYSKNDVLYYINRFFNIVILFVGIGLINYVDFPIIVRFLLVLTTLVQCVIGLRKISESHSEFFGYYVGIKFTIYINIILGSFIGGLDIGYIYSIVCLLISIVSIILGFSKRIKSFRLYGLILAIISVLKLVMIDMTAYNPDFLMFGFIISGLLCFGIVWIYNKMSKTIEEKENIEIPQNNWNNF